MMSDDVVVRVLQLPASVRGFTSQSPDGAYNIYLNALHSQEMIGKTYLHELGHIQNGDFNADSLVSELERKY